MPQIAAGNMGNSILNLIYGQQNDPAQQMSDYANTLQARNRVAIGTDLQGNLLPAPPPGTPPGVGSGQITGAPQDPTAAMAAVQQTGILPQGQEANATKTPQSMGSMIIALQRQQEAAAGLQQSIGLGMSAFARPENRERVFKSFAPQAPMDPTKLGDSIMNLSMQTQGQDRMNALGQMIMDPQRGPGIASQLNIGWDELKARFQADPGATGQMIQSFLTPTDQLKNLQGINRLQAQGGVTAAGGGALGDAASQILGGVAGEASKPMMTAQAAWRLRNPGKPDSAMPWVPNDLASFTQHATDQAALSTEVAEGAGRHSGYIGQANAFNNLVESIQSNKNLDTLLSTPAKRTAANWVINHTDLTNPVSMGLNALPQSIAGVDLSGVSFSPGEKALIADIRQAKGQQYASALHSIGLSRPTGAEVQAIDNGLSQAQNVNMSADDYRKQALNPLSDLIKTQIGTSYGLAHDIRNMPTKFQTYVPPQYLEGGSRHLDNAPSDGSAQWGPNTIMSQQEQADANAALARGAKNPNTGQPYTRYELEQALRGRGKRPNF